MATSAQVRKTQPLRPSDIGIVAGKVVGVWHNWDRLVVRCSAGETLLEWEDPDEHKLIHEAKLIGGALVVTEGASISVSDFRVFSFEKQTWSRRFDLSACDYAIAGHLGSLVAMRNEEKELTELWNIESQEKVGTLDDDFDVVSLGQRVAASNYRGLYLWNDDVSARVKVSEPENDEIVTLNWLKPSELIVGYVRRGVCLFDVVTLQQRPLIECGSEVDRIDIDAALGIVAASADGKMFVYQEGKDHVSVIPGAFGCGRLESSSPFAILEGSGIRLVESLSH